MRIFLDSCFIIYLNIITDAQESEKLYEFYLDLLKHELYIDMLILDEVLYISKKKYNLSYSITLNFLEENILPFVEVIPIERIDFKLMKYFLLKYNLKPSDALHLATMNKAGCNIIVTEDREFDKTPIKRIWPFE